MINHIYYDLTIGMSRIPVSRTRSSLAFRFFFDLIANKEPGGEVIG